jgi:hypothetical protein
MIKIIMKKKSLWCWKSIYFNFFSLFFSWIYLRRKYINENQYQNLNKIYYSIYYSFFIK